MASADQIMPVGDSQPQEQQDPERGTMKPMEIIDPTVPEQQTSVLERVEATLPGSTRIQKWSFVAILTALLLVLIAYIAKCTQTSKPPCPDGYVEITARRLMEHDPDCVQAAATNPLYDSLNKEPSSFGQDNSIKKESDLEVEAFDSVTASKEQSSFGNDEYDPNQGSSLLVEAHDSAATIKSVSKKVEKDSSVQVPSSLLSKAPSNVLNLQDTSESSKPKDSTVLTYQDENFMDDRELFSSILQEPSSYTEGQGAMDTSNMVTDDLQVDQSTLNFLRIDEEEEDLKEASNAVSAKMSKVDQISGDSLKIGIDNELVDLAESAKSSGDSSYEFQHDVLDLPIIQERPQPSPSKWLDAKALAYTKTDLVGHLSPRGSRLDAPKQPSLLLSPRLSHPMPLDAPKQPSLLLSPRLSHPMPLAAPEKVAQQQSGVVVANPRIPSTPGASKKLFFQDMANHGFQKIDFQANQGPVVKQQSSTPRHSFRYNTHNQWVDEQLLN